MPSEDPLVFALGSTEAFGHGAASVLGARLAPAEERSFEDGEHKLRPLIDVRDRDCYVLHSLHGDPDQSVNDKLCRLLFFVATLKDHDAGRVTVLCPYLAYARKDRRTKSHDPVTTRYVAQLFEATGTDRVVVLEPHSEAAFDNAFRIPAVRIHARGPLIDALLQQVGDRPLAVVSPDTGGAKRAAAFRKALAARTGREPTAAFLDKLRSEGTVTGDTVAGEVEGRVAIVVDDMIASGTTMLRAIRACHERGATGVHAIATHALLSDGAEELLAHPALDRLLVTDSVAPRMQEAWGEHVVSISVQPLFAEIIRCLHEGESISDALK